MCASSKTQCFTWTIPDRFIADYLSKDASGVFATRVLGGLLKGILIYLFVWAISLTVTDADLYEYQQSKLLQERFQKIIEEEKKKNRQREKERKERENRKADRDSEKKKQ